MTARLVYIVGPSGSGKDSLIAFARRSMAADSFVGFSRRTITRPAFTGSEDHISVTPGRFDELRAEGAFAMDWQANDFHYGIGREIHDWLDSGRTVVVSGSRAYLPLAHAAFPQLRVVHVTASLDTLRARLAGRGRETAAEIEARLARPAGLKLPASVEVEEIVNEGDIASAGKRLIGMLSASL